MASAVISMSSELRANFAALRRRLQVAQLARSALCFVLSLVMLFLGWFLLDGVLEFSTTGLRVGFAAFLAAGLFVGWRAFLAVLWRPPTRAHLAGLIEKRNPHLEERLTSAVELMAEREPAHGAETLVALVCQDAAQECRGLDFRACCSLNAARRQTWAAIILLAAALAPAFFAPAYVAFGERFFRSWFAPLVGYTLDVTPGDAVVAAGRPAIVTARLERTNPHAPLPDSCHVRIRLGEKVNKQRMQESEPGRFTFVLDQLASDLSYQVEAGEASSALYALRVVEPVQLAADSPVIQVVPPPYTSPEIHPPHSSRHFSDFSALQFSMIRFECQLTRPAVLARIDWKTEAGEARTLPATWNWHEDKAAFTVLLPAKELGSFTGELVLEAEHAITTRYALPRWKVWRDDPPIILERLPSAGATIAADAALSHSATPDDLLKLRCAVEDIVGLDRIDLEYRVNSGPAQLQAIAQPHGKTRWRGDFAFSLAGKVKDGDTLHYRLRVQDGRNLKKNAVAVHMPDIDLMPQTSFDPPMEDGQDRWFALRISKETEPLSMQQILAQQKEIHSLLEKVKRLLRTERKQVDKARQTAEHEPFLLADFARQLGKAFGTHRQAVAALQDLARFAWKEPALEALAELALDIVQEEMNRAGAHLAQAEEKEETREQRRGNLQKADQQLAQALKRLDEIDKFNDRLAQDRLDQHQMERLAQRQDDLAKNVKDLAARAGEPRAKEELDRLRAEQEQIAKDLQQLAEKSQLFKEALEKFRAGQARALAKEAQMLAQEQRERADGTLDSLEKEMQDQLTDWAKKQANLAQRAEALAAEANGKHTESYFPPANQAAESLRGGKVKQALEQQDRARAELDRFAEDLERFLSMGKSPREAALRLAKRQQELREQLQKLAEDFPRLPPDQVRERLDMITKGQKDLATALKKLETPKEAEASKSAAEQEVARIADLLGRKDAYNAFEKMADATQVLDRLAAALPNTQPAPPDPKDSPEEVLAKKRAQAARALAQEQRDLRNAVRKLLDEALRARGDATAKKSERIGEQLMKLAQQSGSEKALHLAKEAAQAAMEAAKSLKNQQSNELRMGETGKKAAQQLEMAAKKADDAAQALEAGMKSKDDAQARAETGEALQQSEKQVAEANRRLQKEGGQPATQSAMKQAAKSLQKSAQAAAAQMSQKAQATSKALRPKGSVGAGGSGQTITGILPKELEPYAGKSWGQLPGELQTKLMQDLRARYGEDYAPIIQRYFQRIAETPLAGGNAGPKQ
ncbi:MAG: hypothetical protein L0Y72_20275 [Gemmataceae bacterium]|nr:hypothetical protein [Gemmataceae bacterium]